MLEELNQIEPPRKNLFSIGKLAYAKGERPKVDCILCGVVEKNEEVPNLTIHETDLSIISVNLYPYNPGHTIIFPKRHTTVLTDLSDAEVLDMYKLRVKIMKILSEKWSCSGFNIGYNLGKFSGGSIPHIHEHVVPRFMNESGFLDVLASTRVVIYEPLQMLEELKKFWNEIQ
jgi:ATP adenylyltransferase